MVILNKKIMSALLTGTLTLTLLTPALAADTGVGTPSSKVVQSKQKRDVKPKNHDGVNILELVEKYTPELAEQFKNVLPEVKERKSPSKLDEATKEKVDAIREQLKNGEITKEEAQEAMEELGVKAPARPE